VGKFRDRKWGIFVILDTGSRIRAGRRTAASPRPTPTRTATAPTGSTSCSTGSVENHAELRARLEAEGQELTSETDAEVVAHLIAAHYDGRERDL
jgi:glutamine phosphoribosylpyrophosphate amidotransferase